MFHYNDYFLILGNYNFVMSCYLMLSYTIFFFEILSIFSISLYPHSVYLAIHLPIFLDIRDILATHPHNYFDLGFYFFSFIMQQLGYSLLEYSLSVIQWRLSGLFLKQKPWLTCIVPCGPKCYLYHHNHMDSLWIITQNYQIK